MTFEPGLLSCSICESDLELSGKEGAILQTRCPNCGMTSDNITEAYLANTANASERRVEVYYKNTAPVSNP